MNRKVLFLDDEPDFLDMYEFILNPPVGGTEGNAATEPAPAQFELTCVTTGEEALIKIEESVSSGNPFAGGFFDLRLGKGINGVETIRRAKDIDPNLLCVIVTGEVDSSVEEIQKVFGAEFSDRWDFLTKPFSQAEILQKAHNLVSNWDRRHREKLYLSRLQTQQEMLIQAERLAAVGTLARGIGHEFGNIVHEIMGRAEMSLSKNNVESLREALKGILVSSERAGIIVRNLQGLVRMEVKREQIDLGLLIQEAIQLVAYEMKKTKVRLVEKYEKPFPTLSLNRAEIVQALLNLLINAIQAMEPKGGGELTLTQLWDGNNVGLEIRDEGIGIAPENLSRIFEPLFTTRPGLGSGIGLSVSKRIVENHNGRLNVRSEPGKGAVFTLWFGNERG